MKLNQISSLFILGAASLVLSACGGGGSPEQKEMTQIEKANEFAHSMNYIGQDRDDHAKYSGQYQLAKGVSAVPGYIVVLDTYNNKYFSVDVSRWSGYTDAKQHLQNETINNKAFYNLKTNLDGTFTYFNADGTKGLTFSKSDLKEVTTNLDAVKAEIRDAKVATATANFASMGLSDKAASGLASSMVAAQESSADGQLSRADLNNLLSQHVGLSFDGLMQAANGSARQQAAAIGAAIQKGAVKTPSDAMKAVSGTMKQLGL